MFNILVITDGKLSSLNQCSSIVNELKNKPKRNISSKYIIYNPGVLRILPNLFIYYFLLIKNFFRKYQIGKTDLIISCGRVSAPLNLVLKKQIKCKNYHILNPYFKINKFDKVIIPEHDIKKIKKNYSPNLITTFGTLVDKKNFQESKTIPSKYFKKNRNKIISVLVGGSGRSSSINFDDLICVIKKLNALNDNFQIIYCFSRRTTTKLKNFIINNANKNSIFFPTKIFNPYWYLFEISNFIFVTGDSISMISDSLSSGKPTYIIPVKKVKKKINFFVMSSIKRGLARVFQNKLETWKYKTLSEARRVCKSIKSDLNL